MVDKHSGLWDQCLRKIEGKIGANTYGTWFAQTSSSQLDDRLAVIEVPTSFFVDWLEEHWVDLIRSTIEEITSWSPEIRFSVRKNAPVSAGAPLDFSTTDASAPSRAPALPEKQDVPPPVSEAVFPLNPRYRFEDFIVGESNQFSFTAAKAVAESPGATSYNPLVIYSGVGLGKTHLLQAIADYCVRNGTASRVVYISAEKFFTDYLKAIRKQDTSAYVEIYRNADILLIDDIQFYVKTEACQRELIHTFNTLYQLNKQIVLSSDRPPSTLKGFEDRLISRFQWGLVSDIDRPDLETRMAIINHKAGDHGVRIPREVARFMAEQIDSNIRELEGALTHLITFSIYKRAPVSLEIARDTIKSLGRVKSITSPTISIGEIQKRTAGYFNISVELLTGATRRQEIATARHICMYLCRRLTQAPLKSIGTEFGNRDHATVIHACKNIAARLSTDADFQVLVSRIQNRVQQVASA
ncbi:MAG: chromosomal replication initiator protein DnaA [Gemmatimonadota bacterium]|nr:chromosomal replication initiator protein DnaA [Gemmatimonadota bacterium]